MDPHHIKRNNEQDMVPNKVRQIQCSGYVRQKVEHQKQCARCGPPRSQTNNNVQDMDAQQVKQNNEHDMSPTNGAPLIWAMLIRPY